MTWFKWLFISSDCAWVTDRSQIMCIRLTVFQNAVWDNIILSFQTCRIPSRTCPVPCFVFCLKPWSIFRSSKPQSLVISEPSRHWCKIILVDASNAEIVGKKSWMKKIFLNHTCIAHLPLLQVYALAKQSHAQYKLLQWCPVIFPTGGATVNTFQTGTADKYC